MNDVMILIAIPSGHVSGERKTSYQFAIHTESQWNKRSEWVIAAQSDREMKDWIDAFKVRTCSTCLPRVAYKVHCV